MALQKGSVAQSWAAEVEEVPGTIPRGRGGKPKIRKLLPDGTESTTETVEMTRASSLGKVLENSFLIHRAQLYKTVFGLSRRPDLVLRAGAVADLEEWPQKKECLAVADDAMNHAGEGWAATRGTALHKLSERMDAGEDLSYLPSMVMDALTVYRRLMSLLRIVASETFVVCDSLGAAGTYDRVVELLNDTLVRWTDADGVEHTTILPAGTLIILDLKTNADAMYFGPVYASQEAVYGNGVPYTHEGGRGEWPEGRTPSREWGLILHLPIESLEDAGFYWVDLRSGYELAQLATRHRTETRRDLFWPTNLEPVTVAPSADVSTDQEAPTSVANEVIIQLIRLATSEDELTQLWENNQDTWSEECSAAAKGRLHDLYSDDPFAAAPGPVDQRPAQVIALELAMALRNAPDEAALTALWEAHEAVWQPAHTQMAKVRAAELAAEVSP
jgi:hypothetical protein